MCRQHLESLPKNMTSRIALLRQLADSDCAAGSQTAFKAPCHGAWTSVPLSSHPLTGWECTVSRIRTPICTRLTTTPFTCRQQQKRGDLSGSPMECEVVGERYETLYFHLQHRHQPRSAWVRCNGISADVTRFRS